MLLMGKSTISMAIFNCYVSSPEGTRGSYQNRSSICGKRLNRSKKKKKKKNFHANLVADLVTLTERNQTFIIFVQEQNHPVDQLLMFEQELKVQCGSYGYASSIQETLGILLAFFTSWFAESPSDGLNPYCSWSTPSQLAAFTASISARSMKNLAGQKPSQPRSRAATAATIRPQQHAGNVFYTAFDSIKCSSIDCILS